MNEPKKPQSDLWTNVSFRQYVQDHSRDVVRLFRNACRNGLNICLQHDADKLDKIEAWVKYKNDQKLKKDTRISGQIVVEHVKSERHHPHKCERDDINLLDLLEMCCDRVSTSALKCNDIDPSKVIVPEMDFSRIIRNTIAQLQINYYNK